MAEPLLPHGLSTAMAELAAAAEASTALVVQRLALLCEAEAKRNVGAGGAHRAGTPTTARRGAGPAVVTGSLRRAVTHEMVDATTARVGAADIPHPPEKPNWKPPTASSGEIGMYVENAGYPWLGPALDVTVALSDPEVDKALLEAASMAHW